MILSGNEIKRRMGKDIFIEPFNQQQLGPNSYNLRLHNELLVYDESLLDMKKEHKISCLGSIIFLMCAYKKLQRKSKKIIKKGINNV